MNAMTDTADPFGFELIPLGTGDQDSRPDAWTVYLPHQCDSWVIAEDPDHRKVLAGLQRFRTELDHVIAELEAATRGLP